jgi:hypothetical protein
MKKYDCVSEQCIEYFTGSLNDKVKEGWNPKWETFTILQSGHACMIIEKEIEGR